MKDSPLVKIFRELGQGAKGSVQDGDALGTIDKYLHVKRPVDDILLQKMHEIDVAAGLADGRKHLGCHPLAELPCFGFTTVKDNVIQSILVDK